MTLEEVKCGLKPVMGHSFSLSVSELHVFQTGSLLRHTVSLSFYNGRHWL